MIIVHVEMAHQSKGRNEHEHIAARADHCF